MLPRGRAPAPLRPRSTLRHLVLAVGAAVGLALGAWSCDAATSPGDAAVAAVALSDTVVEVRAGDEAALVARAVQAGGGDLVGRRIFWSARDTAVATVTQSGVVRGVAVGTTQVAANVEGRAAVARVSVRPRPVAALQIDPATLQLVVGTRGRLTARALNDVGTPVAAPVTWTSEAPDVVSVTGDGEVLGVAPGVGAVRATAEGVSATAAVVVTPVPVARVTVTPTAPSLVVGATQQLTATATDANGATLAGRTVSWTSRDANVASVSSTGQVTGIAPGTAAVVVTVEGQTATASVTVRPVPVAAVRLTPDNTTIGVGGTVRLGAVVADAAGNALSSRPVAFASSAQGVARVAADGTVTGVAPGTATITATSEGVTGSATVRVVAVSTVATVEVTPGSVTLTTGQTRAFTATPRAGDGSAVTGRSVTWSSGGPSVLTVSSGGVVTAVAAGTAQVLAQVDGITGAATVTVQRVPVASVQVTTPSTTVAAGSALQLTATPRDAAGAALGGRVVTWASANETVATVSNDGRVTGVAPGQATVRATSEGVIGAVTVTVNAVVRVSPTEVTVRDRGGESERTAQLFALDQNDRPLPAGQVTWASASSLVATVDATGRVRGVSSLLGTARVTITATYRGATASATVTVTR